MKLNQIAQIFLCTSFIISVNAQQLEIEGTIKIDSLPLDNQSDSLVVKQSDGTLGIRHISTLSDYTISPIQEGIVTVANMPLDIFISGKLAYLVAEGNFGNGSFQILDISNPSDPQVLSEITGISASSIYVAGKFAYLVDNSSNELNIINIAEPSVPSIIETFPLSAGVNSIHVNGPYAAVTSQGQGRLKLINISNPNAPFLIDSVEIGADSRTVFMSGSFIYVLDATNQKLLAISLPEIDEGPIKGEIAIGSSPSGLFVSGIYAYVVDNADNNLKIIDISNSSMLSTVQTFSLGASATDIFVAGAYAYVGFGNGDVKVIDVEDPNTPVVVTQFSGASFTSAVFNSGRFLYLTDYFGNKLKIFEISPSEYAGMAVSALEVGHLQVNNELIGQGSLNIRGGLHTGEGGIITKGDLAVGEEAYVRRRLGVAVLKPTEVLDVNGSARFRSVSTLAPLNSAVPLYLETDGTLKRGNFSDRRLKENIQPLTAILEKIYNLQSYRYTFKSDPNHQQEIGVIAQEIEEFFPELIFTDAVSGMKGVYYDRLSVILLQAIKEQQDLILDHKYELNELRAEVRSIQNLITERLN